MKTETKHTPLPWKVDRVKDSSGFRAISIKSANCHLANIVFQGEDNELANAQYIVTACNTFPALVGALEGLLGDLPSVQGGICQHCGRDYIGGENEILEGDCPAEDCAGTIARAALKLAKGEAQ